MESDAFFTDFIESERHPGQHVNGVADEDEVAGKGITGCVVLFPGEGWFEDEGVRCERLSSEDRAIVGYGGFKALRVDALRWVFAAVSTFLFLSDAGDVAECVSESASEDVGFIGWHPQWFLDGIRESVLGEFEVLEHGGIANLAVCYLLRAGNNLCATYSACACVFAVVKTLSVSPFEVPGRKKVIELSSLSIR